MSGAPTRATVVARENLALNINDYVAVAMLTSALREMQPPKEANERYLSQANLKDLAAARLGISDSEISEEILSGALTRLKEEALFEAFESPHATPRYRFEKRKIGLFNSLAAQRDTPFRTAYWADRNFGPGWLNESFLNARKGVTTESPPAALSSDVPASDRYVSKDDNQAALDDATRAAEFLADAVRGDNEIEEENKLIALSEIAIFEQTLLQPRVPIELIERFARKIIKWMLIVFTGEAVKVAAKALVEQLVQIIGSAN